MEDFNNNMEEFFKRSMERFDELPSDDVWTNISDRIAMEAKWYDPIVAHLRTILPFLLAVLLIATNTVYSKHKNKVITNQLTTAQSKIQNLEKENLEYKNEIDEIKNEFLTVIQEKNKKVEQLNDNLRNQKQLHQSSYYTLRISQQKLIDHQKRTIESLQQDLVSVNAEFLRLHNKYFIKELSSSQIENISICHNAKYLPGVGLFRILHNSDQNLNTRHTTAMEKFSHNIETHQLKKHQRLKLGIHLRYFNTLVKDSKLVNPGIGRGIRAEYKINQKWALTSDFLYNGQSYTIESTQGSIPTDNLKRYPGGVEENSNVQNINTRKKYFDFNLGIKYTPNYTSGKLNFFINPSIVWQLYLPQEFQYNLSQQSDIHYTQKSVTGYFGSAHMGFGFEKEFAKNRILQINLWGEQSFVPLGYEKQFVTMFGLGTTILL